MNTVQLTVYRLHTKKKCNINNNSITLAPEYLHCVPIRVHNDCTYIFYFDIINRLQSRSSYFFLSIFDTFTGKTTCLCPVYKLLFLCCLSRRLTFRYKIITRRSCEVLLIIKMKRKFFNLNYLLLNTYMLRCVYFKIESKMSGALLFFSLQNYKDTVITLLRTARDRLG